MSHGNKKRGRIAAEAARRLMRGGDIRGARIGAARRLSRDWVSEEDLPSSCEITNELSRQRLLDDVDCSAGLASFVGDRFDKIAALVRPLSAIRLDVSLHHAPTLLDATLLSFLYCRQRRPFDEELLTAVLLVDAAACGLDRPEDFLWMLRDRMAGGCCSRTPSYLPPLDPE